MGQLPSGVVAVSDAIALMNEILAGPELKHDDRGRRTREVFQVLLTRYQQDPEACSTEQDLALAIYLRRVDPDQSHVRKAVQRARDYLAGFFASSEASRSLRVEIPMGEYRLRFFRSFLRHGVSPVQWFWSHYRDASMPI